ncbi:MAG TPA: Gfo/Idh/MocA family oxidoreductase [Spirochaetia bacterium]|nr:Gfo/Idh/MocA family oxidoreductase [Spirochaetia bacterium]
MKEKVRICIVGAGAMAARVHYPSLTSFDDVEIVGVCELDEARLNQVCDQFGIPADRRFAASVLGYRAMIEKLKPDGVYVIGQPHLMYDVWTWCLEQGLNLYVEKPMGITIHQAQSLAYLAQTHSCITQVSHQRRVSPLLVKMRDACLSYGPITHAVCEFFKCQISPMLGARDHMLDDCTHSIDTVRWMCGGEVVGIESHCRRIGTPDINWIGATLEFNNGAIGYVVNSWASGRRIFRVQMHAPGIYTDAEVEGKAYLYADGSYEGEVYDAKEVAGSDELYVYGGFRAKNREFIDSLKSGTEITSSPFRDCLKTMEVAEKILAQALLAGV